jgi:hypothetical protein
VPIWDRNPNPNHHLLRAITVTGKSQHQHLTATMSKGCMAMVTAIPDLGQWSYKQLDHLNIIELQQTCAWKDTHYRMYVM